MDKKITSDSPEWVTPDDSKLSRPTRRKRFKGEVSTKEFAAYHKLMEANKRLNVALLECGHSAADDCLCK